MKGILLFCACILALMLPVAAQAHNVACYDWDCNETTKVCSFDASCTELHGLLWRYRWDFGDGSGFVFTGSPTIQHQYSPSFPFPNVELRVIPYDVDWFSVTCQILVYNTFGPPRPTSGTCSQ
jgi:hypothetical protein